MRSPAPWCSSPPMRREPSPARRSRSTADNIWVDCSFLSLRGALATKQSSFRLKDGLLRFARNDEFDDLTHRNPDRTDRDPDVVAAGGTDGGDRENSGVSTGGDDVRDRSGRCVRKLDLAARCLQRASAAAAGMDRRGRWPLRLSRAVFPGAALRTPGGSRPVELSLAAVDRAVFLAAARRAAGAA